MATSDVRGAGTDADVLLTLYGDKGDSGPLSLESSANNFERGQVDTFFVKVSRGHGRCSCLVQACNPQHALAHLPLHWQGCGGLSMHHVLGHVAPFNSSLAGSLYKDLWRVHDHSVAW